MRDTNRPEANHLLAILPTEEFERLLPNLELISLSAGQVLVESGQKLRYAYFPTSAIISMQSMMKNGDLTEVAVVGCDGVVGISLCLGDNKMATSKVVQVAGHAYRLSSTHLEIEFDRHGSTMRILLRYAQTVVTQIAQTAVCNRHHRLNQQLCRWLLLRLNLCATNSLPVTHALIAHTLGVRREGISSEAGKLQASGLIRYTRGKLQVLNQAALENLA